jgi:signal transduction histidine kinase
MLPKYSSIEKDTEYRKFYFPDDLKNGTVALVFTALIVGGFLVNDYLFFGISPFFFTLLILRTAIIFIVCAAIYYIHKLKNAQTYDRSVFLVLMVSLIGGGFINMFRPADFVAQAMTTIISVWVFYLVMPYRFIYQSFFSSVATIGEIFIIVFIVHPSNPPVLFTTIFTLFITNIIAGLSSWEMHAYRHRNFNEFLQRKKAQTALEQHSKQLEKIVEERTRELKITERFAAVGATASMVGHDLRNPLSGISNANYFLKKKYSQQLDQTGKEMLNIIDRSVEYSNKIINDLIDYSGNVTLDLTQKNSPKTLLEDALSMVKIPADVEVINLTENEPLISLDYVKMKRVFINIIKNAIDVMPNGGKLTISSHETPDALRISISDTGPGISPEAQNKLFEPLYTTKAKGMGFGLAISQRIVQAHNGQISFQTQEGEGTTFHIYLPRTNNAT